MPSLQRRFRHVLVIVFFIPISLNLNAGSEGFPGCGQNLSDQEARIHRIEATAAEVAMGETGPPTFRCNA